jgi:hypothetical protein
MTFTVNKLDVAARLRTLSYPDNDTFMMDVIECCDAVAVSIDPPPPPSNLGLGTLMLVAFVVVDGDIASVVNS